MKGKREDMWEIYERLEDVVVVILGEQNVPIDYTDYKLQC